MNTETKATDEQMVDYLITGLMILKNTLARRPELLFQVPSLTALLKDMPCTVADLVKALMQEGLDNSQVADIMGPYPVEHLLALSYSVVARLNEQPVVDDATIDALSEAAEQFLNELGLGGHISRAEITSIIAGEFGV